MHCFCKNNTKKSGIVKNCWKNNEKLLINVMDRNLVKLMKENVIDADIITGSSTF